MFGFGASFAIGGILLLNPSLGFSDQTLFWVRFLMQIIFAGMLAVIAGLLFSMICRRKHSSIVVFFSVLLIGFGLKKTILTPSFFMSQRYDKVMGITTKVEMDDLEPQKSIYQVKKGDTLWKISQLNYGKGSNWRKLVRLDKSRPHLVIGERIEIPINK